MLLNEFTQGPNSGSLVVLGLSTLVPLGTMVEGLRLDSVEFQRSVNCFQDNSIAD